MREVESKEKKMIIKPKRAKKLKYIDIRRSIFVILSIFFLSICFSRYVYADSDSPVVEYNSLDVTAKIEKTGDIKITEKINVTYKNTSTLFRQMNKGIDDNNLKDVKVYRIDQDYRVNEESKEKTTELIKAEVKKHQDFREIPCWKV